MWRQIAVQPVPWTLRVGFVQQLRRLWLKREGEGSQRLPGRRATLTCIGSPIRRLSPPGG